MTTARDRVKQIVIEVADLRRNPDPEIKAAAKEIEQAVDKINDALRGKEK